MWFSETRDMTGIFHILRSQVDISGKKWVTATIYSYDILHRSYVLYSLGMPIAIEGFDSEHKLSQPLLSCKVVIHTSTHIYLTLSYSRSFEDFWEREFHPTCPLCCCSVLPTVLRHKNQQLKYLQITSTFSFQSPSASPRTTREAAAAWRWPSWCATTWWTGISQPRRDCPPGAAPTPTRTPAKPWPGCL